jgi:hypothetical protein
MKITEEYLKPDKYRPSFFDGIESGNPYFSFVCGVCSVSNELDLWSFLNKSSNWEKEFNKIELINIMKTLRLPVNSNGHIKRSHEGGYPYVGICSCINCKKSHLLYIGFYEFQPARYIGTLQGIYGISTTEN